MNITHWVNPENGKITAINELTYKELLDAMDFIIENEPPKFFFNHFTRQGAGGGWCVTGIFNDNYKYVHLKCWAAIKEALQAEIKERKK